MVDAKPSTFTVVDFASETADHIPYTKDKTGTPLDRTVSLRDFFKALHILTEVTDLGDDANDEIVIYDNTGAVSKRIKVDNFFKGVQDIFIPAAAMGANTTGGATFANKEWPTNLQNMGEFLFADAAAKKASFVWKMPRNWDFGAITFSVVWRTTATANNVRFTLRAIAYGDGQALDNANWGTAVAITDTANATANVELETADSGNLTVGNTPSSTRRMVLFELQRDPTHVDDTLATDAYVLGVELHITINKKAAA